MFTWNSSKEKYKPPLPVRLVATPFETFQLVDGGGGVVVSGTEAPELVDLVNGSRELVWLEREI